MGTTINGEWVPGKLEMAANYFGLDSEKFDVQKDEVYGYTDPATGETIRGKYELYDDGMKMEADSFYGYSRSGDQASG